MATIAESLASGMQHHQNGRLQAAENIYHQILQRDPNHVDALYFLGLIAQQLRNYELAVHYLERAVRLRGNVADLHWNLGLAYRAAGKLTEAVTCFRQVLKLKTNDAHAWMVLGLTLKGLREFEESIVCYRRALEIKPDFFEALGNLGNALREQGQLDEAIDCYRRVISLKPNIAEAHCNLGSSLQQQGHLENAISSYRTTIELKPNYAEAHGNLGTGLKELGRLEEATACYRQAISLEPNLYEAHGSLGIVLTEQGLADEAIVCYRRALELRPNDAVSLSNLGNALTKKGMLSEAVECFRLALRLKPDDAITHNNLGSAFKDQGLLDDAIASFQRALDLKPDYAVAHSNLLMTLQYCTGITPPALAAAHAEFDRRQMDKPIKVFERSNRPTNCSPRLGFVSADLGRHPVGYFLIRALESLRKHQFEMFFYSDRTVKDDLTRRFQGISSGWCDAMGMNETRLAQQIQHDQVDILFDLAGHTGNNRLKVFACKPAPIQITWIGYEGTTGLSAMDHLIADEHLIPLGCEKDYRENILRMPDGYLCYEPPDAAPPVGPLPALENGFITFGSFNNLAKITPQVVKAWSEILRRLPTARLVMKYSGLGDPFVKQRYLDSFASNGIGRDRLQLVPSTSYAEYLASYRTVDLMLDPFPFAGGTTTCEALWMGVPVVTCGFETFASRHSVTHLSNIGLNGLISQNLDEYVELAVSLSNDLPRLACLRAGLREQVRTSPLCDGERFAANLAWLLKKTWDEYEMSACATKVTN